MLAAVLIGSAFAGCSDDKKEEKKKEESTSKVTVDPEYATDKAVIKEIEAINFIKESYSEKELGLDKTDEDYSLMIASTATEIEGEKYVNVVANVRHESDTTTKDGGKTFTFKTVGSYFISFDGKTVLKKDLKTGKYSELENRYSKFKEKSTSAAEKTTDKK